MTDADIDGAHIRTLLLTFFFRQMLDLIVQGKIFIAQPPLYELKMKGKKKSEYVLNEPQMRKRMEARGLEGTVLYVRDGDDGPAEIEGSKLALLVKLLNDVERTIGVLDRRGIVFGSFVKNYYDGQRLPTFHIRVEGESEFFYDKAAYEKRLADFDGQVEDGHPGGNGSKVVAEELHEVVRLNEVDKRIRADFGFDMRDFLLKAAKAVSGEALPTKFEITCGDQRHQVASLGGICPAIREIGGQGIQVKRFKGLGEMNSDQLWDTTMNPEKRTLLQVKLEDAVEASRLFSILMGDDVEKRRNFIREHALEVQNLDV
ncbi:MAG: DNA gyrase subunit B, partial [Planctomycetes bacterium]|nr:DNA gyrase subunit B [Planctomycetota bacterium]